MAKHSVDDLYGEGRRFPHGRVRDGSHHRIAHNPPMETPAERNLAHNRHDNQAPEERHGAKYDGDHPNDWVRGAGESATGKPGFDFGGAWRLGREGVEHGPGDTGQQRKPVGEKP